MGFSPEEPSTYGRTQQKNAGARKDGTGIEDPTGHHTKTYAIFASESDASMGFGVRLEQERRLMERAADSELVDGRDNDVRAGGFVILHRKYTIHEMSPLLLSASSAGS